MDWRARSHGELHKLMPPPYQSPIPMSTTKSRSEPHLSQEIPTFLYGSGLHSGPASRSTRLRPQSLSSNEWPWGEDRYIFCGTLHGCVIADMTACEIGQFLEKMCYCRDKPLDGLVTRLVDDRYTYADIGRTVLHCFGPRDEQNIPLYRTVKLGDVDLRPDKGHSVAKEQEEQRQPTEKVGGPHTDQSQRCQRSPPSYEYGETHVPRIICPKPEEKVRFLKGGFLDSIRKAECNTDEGKLVAGKLQVKRLSSIRETGKYYPIPRKVVGIEGKATLVTIPPARGKHQEQKARNLRTDGQYLGEYPNWLLREGASFPGGQQGQ